MMHAAAALVLAFVVATAWAAPPSAAFVLWSRDTCRADAQCAVRFGLPPSNAAISEYDTAHFSEMLTMFVAQQQNDIADVASAVADCVDSPDTPGCSRVQLLWATMLRQAHPCSENEEWVLGVGCECIDGKQCVSDCTQAVINNVWPFALAVAICCVFMLVMFIWDVRKFNEMDKRGNERYERTLVAHYTLQGQLYLASSPAPLAPPTRVTQPSAISSEFNL